MDELKWELLTEVQGRLEADLLKSYFQAYGVEVELFQESIGQHIYPTTLDLLGRVQIFVAKKNSKIAQKLLKEYYDLGEIKSSNDSAKRPRGVSRSASKRLKSPLQKPTKKKNEKKKDE